MTLFDGVTLEIEPPSPVIELATPPAIAGLLVPIAGVQGPRGVQGAQGVQGAPGAPGDAPQAYHHDQGVPSASWVIVHNLGYNPAGIVVHDSGGNQWVGPITYVDLNTLRIDFDVPFGGTADLS